MEYIHNGILIIQSFVTIDESGGGLYIKWNKPDIKRQILYDLIYMYTLEF